jgi:hypothetical protein
MRGTVLIGVMAAAITAAVAGSDVALTPRDWFGSETSAPPRSIEKPVFRSIRLGTLEVIFEKTRLKTVLARAGVGTIRTQGDASESETWLCYRFHTERGVAQIDLVSGEMGGGEIITSIVLRDGKLESDKQCPELPAALLPIATDLGPGLGSRYEDFVRVLGKPTERTANRTSWAFERRTRFPGSPELWFIEQGVHAGFREGKANLVLFTQVTTD